MLREEKDLTQVGERKLKPLFHHPSFPVQASDNNPFSKQGPLLQHLVPSKNY
jgi:hypothetical protein